MIRFEHGGLALLLACVLGCGEGDDDAVGAAGQGGGNGAGGGGQSAQVSFAENIHPILLAKCAGSACHSVANSFQPGHAAEDIDEAYEAATGVNSTGDLVYERILARVTGDDPRGIMPPSYPPTSCGGSLGAPGCVTQAEFDLIQAWVDQGRPE